MIGTPGAITERIKLYRDGGTDFPDLTRYLAEYAYPDPVRDAEAPDDAMYQGVAGNWDPDRTEMGTWDEVRWNRDVGNLTRQEYLIINKAAWDYGKAHQAT